MQPKIPPSSPYDIVILVALEIYLLRKLLPALYMAHAHGKLEGDTRIIGIGRQSWSREQYLDFINEQSPPFIKANAFKQDDWQSFLNRLQFVQLDLNNPQGYARLKLVCSETQMRVFILLLRLVCLPRFALTYRKRGLWISSRV